MTLRKSLLFVLALLGCATTTLQAQSLPNIDWETGTYANWLYYTGSCCPSGTISTPSGTSAVSGRHTLTSGTATDPYGGFPTVSPWGGSYSLKLGNDVAGGQAERCRYYVHIPSTATDYSLIYHYAAVLQNPGHSPVDQPRMEIKAYDSATGLIIPCDSFVYIASGSIPGFFLSSSTYAGGNIYYRPWTMGNMRFNGLGGHTIVVDFATGDCSPTGHFGYGYVDMTAGLFANTITICGSSVSTVNLTGPNGYSAYSWKDSATFLISYGTSQNVTISAPSSTTTYAVILTPYSGYGCPDTLYTKVVVLTPCSGTPATGVVSVHTAAICSDPDTLVCSAYATYCGLSFQWQSSPDGSTWSNISGATSATYTYTHSYSSLFYRCIATCVTSGLSSASGSVYVPGLVGPGLYSVTDPPDTMCDGAEFYISACGSSTAYSVHTWFGDGTADTTALTTTGLRHAYVTHHYGFPGTYSVRHLLYDGTLLVDSSTYSYNYLYCSTFPLRYYFDADSDCIVDAGETNIFPIVTEIDSSGIPIDTISALSGLYYQTLGAPGTQYTFKILMPSGGQVPSCPSSGIIYDTVLPYVNMYEAIYQGLNCGTSGFDLSEIVSLRCFTNRARGTILVRNSACTSTIPTITINHSPRYVYWSAVPSATSYTATSVTWNLSSLSARSAPESISFELKNMVPLIDGDTINSKFVASPIIGDADTSNNIIIRNDTVNGSYDPNYIEVTPQGYITSGTNLQYTIHFENTGRDTAFNIHVMDTLSGLLDVHSMRMVGASHEMNLALFNVGGLNIAKFDFPNINLLDSSHHGLCTGMFTYTINSLTGLPPGTIIPNRVGIYFDYNPVVMTNTVNNIIPFPGTLTTHVYDNDDVQIFPNPAYNEITIKMSDSYYNSFTISNQVGQTLVRQQLSSSTVKADISMLPSGLYFITLKGENGGKVMKFVKM